MFLRRLANRLSTLAQAVGVRLLLVYVVARFLLRAKWSYFTTARRGFALVKRLRRDGLSPSPLSEIGSHLFEVKRVWLQSQATQVAADGALPAEAVVLHFTGTGETRHGPMVNLARLLKHTPELAALRHYVIDAPGSAVAYHNSLAFGTHLWHAVAPIVEAHPGPFLCVGLSRGGLAALEIGMRIATEKHKPALSLACSPPLLRPQRLPPTIELVGALRVSAEDAANRVRHQPACWTAPIVLAVCAWVQTLITCFVLAELEIDDDDNLAWAMRDVVGLDNVATSLRLTREFSLLGRASQAELTHFLGEVGENVAHSPLFSAVLCWGVDDAWTPALKNLALAQQIASMHPEASGSLQACVIPGCAHAMCRQHTAHVPLLAAQWQQAVSRLGNMVHSSRLRSIQRTRWEQALRHAHATDTTLRESTED